MKLHVEMIGKGPRVVLVHGAMGYPSWRNQKELSQRFQLEILICPGYPPNPPEPEMGFDIDAKLVANHLGDGAHLVGHSYGGIVCLLAASFRPEAVHSLTVTEPPCFDVARGNHEVEDFVAALEQLYASGVQDPRQFMMAFMEVNGLTPQLPDPLPPVMRQLAECLKVERVPWEAQIPLTFHFSGPHPHQKRCTSSDRCTLVCALLGRISIFFSAQFWPYIHMLLAFMGGYCYNLSKPTRVSFPESPLFFQTSMVISRLRSNPDYAAAGL